MHNGGVDVSTGVYTREDDDLHLDTQIAVVLRRTHLSGDRASRRFGIGATHPGEWWLYGEPNIRVSWADLILANGGRIHFTRISPGDTQETVVLRHEGTPTEFNGALLSWNGSQWEMRFRDGGRALFLGCQRPGQTCSLIERRDAHGNRVAYVRDASGRLLAIESEGQSISFEYDDRRRVVRAYDKVHNSVDYTYDNAGRLVRAAGSDGIVREYDYNERDELVAVREPGRMIQNWFDDSARLIRQEVRDSPDDPDPYVATVAYIVKAGNVVQTDFDEGYGTTSYRFNAQHYIVSEVLGADGRTPVTFMYDRDSKTNEIRGATMSCTGAAGPLTVPVPLTSDADKRTKFELVRNACASR